MSKPKTPPKLSSVKSFEYTEGSKRTRALLCKSGKKFGVVMFTGDIAFSLDYKNPSAQDELRTFIGNEAQIIDWVAQDEAESRYSAILARFLDKALPKRTAAAKPILRIVQ